jgi:transposase
MGTGRERVCQERTKDRLERTETLEVISAPVRSDRPHERCRRITRAPAPFHVLPPGLFGELLGHGNGEDHSTTL